MTSNASARQIYLAHFDKVRASRIAIITTMLNASASQAEIGRFLGVSKQRIGQLVHAQIPIESLSIPCAYCGRPLPAEIATSHLYHEECGEVVARQGKSEWARARRNWPRRKPDGLFEHIALREYTERGYDVLHMPTQCLFDYVVNGLRVDVKGSRRNKRGSYQYRTRQRGNPAIAERCDIVHCIGASTGSAHEHYIIPARAVGDRRAVVIARENSLNKFGHERLSRWHRWRDCWYLLDGRHSNGTTRTRRSC